MTVRDQKKPAQRLSSEEHILNITEARRRAQDSILHPDAADPGTGELEYPIAVVRALLECTSDGVLAVDSQSRVISFNEKFVEMWRIPRELLAFDMQQRLMQFGCSQLKDPLQFLARLSDILASPSDSSFDLIELADGRIFERLSKPIVVNGEPAGRLWTFRDITERLHAAEALQDKTRTLEILNETGRSLVSTLDLQALVQEVTDAATRMSGAKYGAFFYTARSDEGEVFQLYALSGADREAFERLGKPRATPLFGPIFKGEKPIRLDDVLADPRYGRMTPHHGMPRGHLPVRSYLAVPVKSRAGEILGGLLFGHPETGIFTERTEEIIVGIAAQAAVAIDNARLYEAAQSAAREREMLLANERHARAEAVHANQMKDQFLAMLSHELRTPLNAILGWAQILRQADRSSDDMARGLEVIERNARVQAQLIEGLLDMHRVSAGKVILDRQTVSPLSLIQAALETVRPAAEAKRLQLSVTKAPVTSRISADPNRLQQVIWNLLSNAVKFTPEGGTITVELEENNSQIEIKVSDTGIGIDTAFLPHVFTPFRQADASSTRKYGGLGIGLAIVKNLVELHGGTVQAHSEGQGTGATFVVRLPSVMEDALLSQEASSRQSQEAIPPAPPEWDLSRLTVLVVDDQADACELVRAILEQCGASVVTASSTMEAIGILQTTLPDLLISDIGMPDTDGFGLLQRIRMLDAEACSSIPAIALTAFARPDERTRTLQAGFAAHVAKPLSPAELLSAVGQAVGNSKAQYRARAGQLAR